MRSKNNILIIEDDPDLADCLSDGLTEEGYCCQIASSGKAAEAQLNQGTAELVLLDLGLPDIEGSDLLKTIRSTSPNLPVIVVTARSNIADRIELLENGADDYLIKPYAFDELLARIRIQFRHVERAQQKQSVGDLSIDQETHSGYRAGRILDLTPLEFNLLSFLASRQGEPVSREMLWHEVWQERSIVPSMNNTIDVFISRLRQKLTQPDQKQLLHTVRGVGFMLKEIQ